MIEPDLKILAERLAAAKFEVPLTAGFCAVWKLETKWQTLEDTVRISGAAEKKRGVLSELGRWPIHRLHDIRRAIETSNFEALGALPAFFEAVAVVHHLKAGRKMRQELLRLFPKGFPFPVIALARIFGRSRSLTPRPPAHMSQCLSDVELLYAWKLWAAAEVVHEELSRELREKAVAGTCSHCGQLHLRVASKYCSEKCRKAYGDNKYYRHIQSETRTA